MDSYGKGYHVRLAGALLDPVLEGVAKDVLRSLAYYSRVYGQADVHGQALGKIVNP